jgi:hypothetical protein
MTGQRLAAVRHTIKVCLTPVEGGVKSNGHPEITGGAQQEAGQQTKRASIEQSDPIFTGVAVMRITEVCRR